MNAPFKALIEAAPAQSHGRISSPKALRIDKLALRVG
jgi:hypothetical protein